MHTNRRSGPIRRWPLVLAGLALLAVGLRFGIAAAGGFGATDFGGIDALLLAVVVGAISLLLLFRWAARKISHGLDRVRHARPDSVAVPVSLVEDEVENIQRMSGTRMRAGFYVASFSKDGIEFWRGRKAEFVARIPSSDTSPIKFDLGHATSIYGRYSGLAISNQNSAALKLFPMSEQSVWFPRNMQSGQVIDLVTQLRAT